MILNIQKRYWVLCSCWLWATFSGFAQTDYTLPKALQTARANSPILKTQRYNIDIASTDIVSAKIRPNPVLNNQTLQSLSGQNFAPGTDWTSSKNNQVWWQFTKPIQLPNQRKFKIELAEKNVLQQQKIFNEFERNLLLDVANKWLDAWALQRELQLLTIAKNNIDSLQKINQLRYAKEVITQIDLSRTEILSKQYDLQIKSLEQDYKNERLNLAYLMGSNDGANLDLNEKELALVTPSNVDSLLQKAFENRSDLAAVKANINAAETNIHLQKALATPQPEIGLIYNPQNSVPYGGIFVTIPIPFFDRNQGQIQKSKLLKQQAEQALGTTQFQIENEIQRAIATFRVQKSNLDKYQGLLTQSQNVLNSVKYSYLRGGTTIIDFLEAQRSWLDTQQQYYDTQRLYRQSYIYLMYVTGIISQMAE